MESIPARNRPHYAPTERMAILKIRAARGWSIKQTAQRFLIEPETVGSWTRRVDEDGPGALVQTDQPVNRYPEYIRHIVRTMKVLFPLLGKRKIAQMLARAGLHLGTSTVWRAAKMSPMKPTFPAVKEEKEEKKIVGRLVTAKYPNHLWHVDLTIMPTHTGFWTSWLPFALPQVWPFCWWVGLVIDHYSRVVLGFVVFRRPPSSIQMRAFLARVIRLAGQAPRHLVCDKGSQFWCEGFKTWCKRRGVRLRFGAVGKYGSLAVIERCIKTIKDEYLRRITVPLRHRQMRGEIAVYIDWYNEHRPHTWLGGRTPNEVYHGLAPASKQPRFEPRPKWPKRSPCASPQAPIRGQPGVMLELHTSYFRGRPELPVIDLREAA